MSSAATIVAMLAVAGIFASWAVGAAATLRALRMAQQPMRGGPLLAVIAWPVLAGRLKEASPPEYGVRVNKALVALFVCAMVAAASFSLAANLSRISR